MLHLVFFVVVVIIDGRAFIYLSQKTRTPRLSPPIRAIAELILAVLTDNSQRDSLVDR